MPFAAVRAFTSLTAQLENVRELAEEVKDGHIRNGFDAVLQLAGSLVPREPSCRAPKLWPISCAVIVTWFAREM